MKEIKVTFKTLTPLWTGDAWGENKGIRPSSLMGSLRFWFYIYCKSSGVDTEKLNKDGVPADNINEYVKEYNKKNKIKESFESLLQKEIIASDYDTAVDKVFEKINLPLISRIFGCTGWKSMITIKDIDYDEQTIKKSDINFKFLYDKLQTGTYNSKFWANKLLFKDKDKIKVFKNVRIKLLVNDIYKFEFEKFVKFYQGKVILIGGKKSFGFGFCKITIDKDLKDITLNTPSTFYKDSTITIDSLPKDKIVLGFNFKHYQRLKENKSFRESNFGTQEKGSNFYFSFPSGNSLYIIEFMDSKINDGLFDSLMAKYSNFKFENNGG